jgi:glycerate 2-kinase
MRPDARALLTDLFKASIDAARPELCVAPHLPQPPKGRTIVIGAGKAAASMAAAFEAHWSGPFEGLVVTRYGHALPTKKIEVVEAAHPVPDDAGAQAAKRMLDLVARLTPDDLVICLVSGGGSALLAAPLPGLSHAEKQDVSRALLRCGADIAEMNCVRKHLSAIKGGRLARAVSPAKLVTLAISDVPGDDPSVIASGPTVPDPTTLADARAVLTKYALTVPSVVRKILDDPSMETPKPNDPCFANTRFCLVSRPQDSLLAAAEVARSFGVTPLLLGDALEGEARDVGRVMAGIARSCAQYGHPSPSPCVLLSGGETSVTVKGGGRGGRNVEFLLALAIALKGNPRIAALAGDTDGIDGSEYNAGAYVHPSSLALARQHGLDAEALLADNDAFSFFEALQDLVVTGPTLTNVNDFRAVLIDT